MVDMTCCKHRRPASSEGEEGGGGDFLLEEDFFKASPPTPSLHLAMDVFPLHRMDKDGNVRISWEEWREYLLLQPHTSVSSIFKIWSHSTVSRLLAHPSHVSPLTLPFLALAYSVAFTCSWVCTLHCPCIIAYSSQGFEESNSNPP